MKYILITMLALCGATFAHANHHEKAEEQSLFHGAFLQSLDHANGELISLAEAFDEKLYDWRPAEGIRSVKDTILHTAGANFALGSMLGAKMPDGINPWELEKTIKTREDAIATLKKSIEFSRSAIAHTSEKDLGTMIDLFGNQSPKMSAALIIGAHANEHLGQLIAYARSNGVVPPWSK